MGLADSGALKGRVALITGAATGIGRASALLFAGAHFTPERNHNGPVLTAAVSLVTAAPTTSPATTSRAPETVAAVVKAAVGALTGAVRPLSRPRALEDAFHSYFAYKTAHPDQVRGYRAVCA